MKTELLSMIVMAVALVGCEGSLESNCRKSTDCQTEEFCVAGKCDDMTRTRVAPSTSEDSLGDPTGEVEVEAEIKAETEADGVTEEPSDIVFDPATSPCGEASQPAAGDLAINEILASVPSDDGDANNDGVRDAFEDEFIEFVNISTRTLELSRLRLRVDGKSKFVFEPHCLKPMEPLVLFGGGSVNIEARDVEALTSDTRLSLTNDGAVLELEDANGELLVSAEYGSLEGRSWVLDPEIVGESYKAHAPGLFSPGRCANNEKITRYCFPE